MLRNIKFLKWSTLTFAAAVVMGCTEDPDFDPTVEAYIAFEEGLNLTPSVVEGCGDVLTFRVEIPFIATSGTASITLSGATATTDYSVSGGTFANNVVTVNLEADISGDNPRSVGSFSLSFPNDNATDGGKTLELLLTGVTAQGVSSVKLGTWAGAGKRALVAIADANGIDFSGTYIVSTLGTGAGCEGETLSSSVTIARVSGTTYSISDITFGLYPECYSADGNEGEIDIDPSGVISFTNVPDVVYGGDDFDGSGAIDPCTFEFEVTWSNNYGDSGLTTGGR